MAWLGAKFVKRDPPFSRRHALAEDVLFWLRAAVWSRLYDSFDREHGTQTRGSASLHQLGVRHPNARFGVHYQAIDPRVFKRAVRSLPRNLDLKKFTFVDLGCGKGRALILASKFGFGELVGVELSAALAEQARANLKKANIKNGRAICHDAANVQFPVGNLVVYLFHPFVGEVFRQTIRNLCASARGDVYFVYVNPVEEQVLRESPCFVRCRTEATFVIYHHHLHNPSRTPLSIKFRVES